MEYKRKREQGDLESDDEMSDDEMMRKWADATARGRQRAGAQSQQQRGVGANQCNMEEI